MKKDSKSSSESDSSSSDSDSDSESDSSSGSSSDESTKAAAKKSKSVAKSAKATVTKEDLSVTKKRRTDEQGASVPTAVHVNANDAIAEADGTQNGNGKNRGDGKKPRQPPARFQRIKMDKITFVDERLKDNSFDSRVSLLVPNDVPLLTSRRVLGRMTMALVLRAI